MCVETAATQRKHTHTVSYAFAFKFTTCHFHDITLLTFDQANALAFLYVPIPSYFFSEASRSPAQPLSGNDTETFLNIPALHLKFYSRPLLHLDILS